MIGLQLNEESSRKSQLKGKILLKSTIVEIEYSFPFELGVVFKSMIVSFQLKTKACNVYVAINSRFFIIQFLFLMLLPVIWCSKCFNAVA